MTSSTTVRTEALVAFRVAAVAWLITAYCKVNLYLVILEDARRWPVVEHPLFPAVFRSPELVTFAYWLPLVVVPLLLVARRWALTLAASILLGSSFVLGWSLDTHNDATWITAFWAAVWMMFVAASSTRTDDRFVPQAIALAQGTIAVCFFGGFFGKLTAQYFDGEALFHIYVQRKENLPWPWLREALQPEGQRAFALWFSRATIVMEGAMCLVLLVPARWGCPAAAAALVGIVVVSDPTLLSVMACLLGLLAAAWWLDRRKKTAG